MSVETDLLLVKQKVEQIEAQLSSKITYNQLSTLAGNGLAGSGATTLDVNVDNSTLEINLDTLRVKDGGITSAKILDGTIVAGDIANGTIVAANIANDTLTATQIAVDAIGSSELADNAVDTAAIAALAVTTAKINALAVTKDKLAYDGGNMIFATTAARLAAIPSPVAGMTAYINSGDSSEGLYSYTGTTWNKGPSWNAPWGLVGKVTSTSSSSTQGPNHTIQQDGTNPLTVTLTTVTNRNYLVTSQHISQQTSTRHRFSYVINGVTKYSIQQMVNTGAEGQTATGSYVFTETSGASKIFKVQMYSGTNVVSTDVGIPDFERLLLIQDIGPSGAPA